jgi:hypothetical protein
MTMVEGSECGRKRKADSYSGSSFTALFPLSHYHHAIPIFVLIYFNLNHSHVKPPPWSPLFHRYERRWCQFRGSYDSTFTRVHAAKSSELCGRDGVDSAQEGRGLQKTNKGCYRLKPHSSTYRLLILSARRHQHRTENTALQYNPSPHP